MINASLLDKWIESCNKLMRINPKMNESNTKSKLIGPLLELLEWDIIDDVTLEFPVRIGSRPASADYALLIDSKPKVLVEAKGFDSDLHGEFSQQAVSYGRVSGIRWVIITNGKNIIVFDSEVGPNSDDCIIFDLKVDDYKNNIDTINMITKSSMRDGLIIEYIKQKEAKINYLKLLNQNRSSLSNYIYNKIKNDKIPGLNKIIEEQIQSFFVNTENSITKYFNRCGSIELPTSKNVDVFPGDLNDEVVIFPTKPNGIDFLLKYNCWGFVRINRAPKYFALYVAKPHSKILYFGEIESISEPLEDLNSYPFIDEKDRTTFSSGKKIIRLKPGSIRKLDNPISLGDRKSVIQGLFYSNIQQFRKARVINDLLIKS